MKCSGGSLIETNWMAALSPRHKFRNRRFEFFLLKFPPFCHPFALCLAGVCVWLLFFSPASHSSTPGSLSVVENPCPVSQYYTWWFLCLIVSASCQLQLSHGSLPAPPPPGSSVASLVRPSTQQCDSSRLPVNPDWANGWRTSLRDSKSKFSSLLIKL